MSEQQVPNAIRSFESPGEYKKFCAYIAELVASNLLAETDADPDYGPGEVYGGRWFKDRSTNEVWRLVAPDYPFKGVWERVYMLPSSLES